MTVIIECISWLINVTNNNDAQRKPEIDEINLSISFISFCSFKCTFPFSFIYLRTELHKIAFHSRTRITFTFFFCRNNHIVHQLPATEKSFCLCIYFAHKVQ